MLDLSDTFSQPGNVMIAYKDIPSKILPRNLAERMYFWGFFVALPLFLLRIFDRNYTVLFVFYSFVMYVGKRFETPYPGGRQFGNLRGAIGVAMIVVAFIAVMGFFFGNW